jgi:hypothetical protein
MRLYLKFALTVFIALTFTSCGPSPANYKTEDIKSTCDCLKMRGELTKHSNEFLASESDKEAQKALQDSEDYEQWTKKDEEIIQFCNKKYKDYFGDEKCPEYKTFHTEFERSHELYQSDWD